MYEGANCCVYMSHFMTKFSKKQDALSQALGCLQSIQHFPLSHCGYTAPFFMFTCSIIQGLSSDLLFSYCVTWCAIIDCGLVSFVLLVGFNHSQDFARPIVMEFINTFCLLDSRIDILFFYIC